MRGAGGLPFALQGLACDFVDGIADNPDVGPHLQGRHLRIAALDRRDNGIVLRVGFGQTTEGLELRPAKRRTTLAHGNRELREEAVV